MNSGQFVVQTEDNECRTTTLEGKARYAVVGQPPAFVRVWDDSNTYIIPMTRLVFLVIPNSEKEKNDG